MEDIEQCKAEIIMDICNNYFGVDTRQDTRARHVSEPRQIVFYFLRKYTRLSLQAIGGFYNKDHATALHGNKKISNLIMYDKNLKKDVLKINDIIRENFKPKTNETVISDIKFHLDAAQRLIEQVIISKNKEHVLHNY